MAKRDYKAADIKNSYKTKVRRQTLTKVAVSADEKRARAELLDMVEELFEGSAGTITAEKLRAFMHIMVKSVQNSTDDEVEAENLGSTCTGDDLPTSDPRVRGRLWNDRDTVKVSRG